MSDPTIRPGPSPWVAVTVFLVFIGALIAVGSSRRDADPSTDTTLLTIAVPSSTSTSVAVPSSTSTSVPLATDTTNAPPLPVTPTYADAAEVGGFDETAGCQPTVPLTAGFEVPGFRDPTPTWGGFWYGTPGLWTVLNGDGSYDDGMSAWWSINFPGGSSEGQPDLTVTALRLDADVAVIVSGGLGTNAAAPGAGWFMIADFPPLLPSGCWEVTGTYKGASLSYVLDVP